MSNPVFREVGERERRMCMYDGDLPYQVPHSTDREEERDIVREFKWTK